MEGWSKIGTIAAVLVCFASVFFGWQETKSSILEKLRVGNNLGRVRPAATLSDVRDESSRLSILYVMDPSIYSWEYVHIDDFTNETVIAWMRGLTDALTARAATPGGLPLMVSTELIF
jgi:hypothetical protein